MALNTNRVEVHLVDYSDERSLVDVPISTGNNNQLNAFANAVDAVSLNTFVTSIEVRRQLRLSGSPLPPSDPQAQNELAWRVTVRDTVTNQLSYFSIPGADTLLLLPNSDVADLSTPQMTELVLRIEQVVGGEDGDPVLVEDIRLTGQ